MTAPTTDKGEWAERMRLLAAAEADPEKAHALEDALLWRVCGLLESRQLAAAKELARLLVQYDRSNPDRERWCA